MKVKLMREAMLELSLEEHPHRPSVHGAGSPIRKIEKALAGLLVFRRYQSFWITGHDLCRISIALKSQNPRALAGIGSEKARHLIPEMSEDDDLSKVSRRLQQGVVVGEYVTCGHRVTLHACTVGNEVLVGMGATIMDGAAVGDRCIIGA
ncbi:MAG TPA: hypothetical protein PLL76_20805, partial [Thermoanaerobaculia bacterium]|nr:hypothetical protein [Thermoanaerobaculia bacterium]